MFVISESSPNIRIETTFIVYMLLNKTEKEHVCRVQKQKNTTSDNNNH